MHRIQFMLASGIFILAMTGCSPSKPSERGQTMNDLGSPRIISEADIILLPPKGWNDASPAMLAQYKGKMSTAGQKGAFTAAPVAAFIDTNTGSSCLVAVLTAAVPGNMIDTYIAQFEKQFAGKGSIKTGEESIGPFRVRLLRLITKTITTYKVIYMRPGAPIIQIDYIFPTALFDDSVGTVNASIASVSPRR